MHAIAHLGGVSFARAWTSLRELWPPLAHIFYFLEVSTFFGLAWPGNFFELGRYLPFRQSRRGRLLNALGVLLPPTASAICIVWAVLPTTGLSHLHCGPYRELPTTALGFVGLSSACWGSRRRRCGECSPGRCLLTGRRASSRGRLAASSKCPLLRLGSSRRAGRDPFAGYRP